MKTNYSHIGDCRYRVSAKAILRDANGLFGLCLKEMTIDGVTQENWDFPGGGIDHGEDTFQTIRREVMEEMGLTVTHISPQPKYFFIGESACTKVPLGLVFYETEVENYNFTPSSECKELHFFTLEQALQASLWPAVRTNLEEAKELFGKF